jgi:hypothetical protein
MSKSIHHGWVVGAKVSAPIRWSTDWTDYRIVTKVTSAGNVALDGGAVEYRIDGESIYRRGDSVWDRKGYWLMTPGREAMRDEGIRRHKHKVRAQDAALMLDKASRHDPDSVPPELIDAIEAALGAKP